MKRPSSEDTVAFELYKIGRKDLLAGAHLLRIMTGRVMAWAAVPEQMTAWQKKSIKAFLTNAADACLDAPGVATEEDRERMWQLLRKSPGPESFERVEQLSQEILARLN